MKMLHRNKMIDIEGATAPWSAPDVDAQYPTNSASRHVFNDHFGGYADICSDGVWRVKSEKL
jgi:hypothetical protein